MKQYLARNFCLWMCLIWSGCSVIIPQSNYIWSENYTLDENGGRCSIPEVIDGDLQTSGRLGVKAVGTLNRALSKDKETQFPTELRRFGRSYSFAQAKVYPQVDIQFRKRWA